MRPFIRYDSDHLTIRAYKPDEPLPGLQHLPEPYSWSAPKSDEAWLRSILKDADWPPPDGAAVVVGPDRYGSITPRSFQFATRQYGSRLLLADDPGLGKTVEALMFSIDRNVASIIICRASAKQQWMEEATRMGLSPSVWKGGAKEPSIHSLFPTDVQHPLILHYDQLPRLKPVWVEGWLKDAFRRGVILDECHAIKNPTAGRTARVFELFWKVPYKVLISATPIRNRTAELWPQLAFLDSERFGNWPDFALRYCGGKYLEHGGAAEGIHLEAKGTTNWEELLLRMSPFLLRRTYEEVKLQLPPISRTTLSVDGKSLTFRTEERDFGQRMKDWAQRMRTQGRMAFDRQEILAAIQHYRFAASVEKGPTIVEWLRGRSRTLVVSSFSQVLDAIRKQIPEALLLTGAVPAPLRPQLLEEFRKSEVPLLATMETGGESLNLQSAHEIAFVDLPWVPAAIKQAEMRVWRQGQHDPVVVSFFVVGGSIEEKVVKMLLSKEKANPWSGEEYKDILGDILNLQQEART